MMELKSFPQVKVVRSGSSEAFEKEINEFCKSHSIVEIQYPGISNNGTYSAMIIYVESEEIEVSDEDTTLFDSIKKQMGIVSPELKERIDNSPSMTMEELEGLGE